MTKCNVMKAVGKILVLLYAGVVALNAAAQDHIVEFSNESGIPGSTVPVTFTFTNPGGASAVEARARISDVGAFSNIDLNSFCSGAQADFISCPLNDTNRIVIALANFDASEAIQEFTGEILFTIDPGIDPATLPQTIEIEWGDEGLTFTPTDSIDGSVEILAATAVLNVQPPAINFGSQQTGSTSAPQPVTISNEGTDGVDLLVTAVDITGPFAPEAGGTCDAVPFSLADGESCIQHVEFSPTSDGLASGTMTVVSDAGEVINSTVDLSGEGTPPPVELVVAQSPDYGVVGGPIYGTVVVHVLDTNGDLFTDDSSTVVELSLVTDPSGMALLSGDTEVTVSNGVAIFNNLSIDQVGTGFELRANDQSGLLDDGDSDAFPVLPLDLFQDRFETVN